MIPQVKSALRRHIRSKSGALAPGYRAQASAAICAHLARLPQLPWTRSLLVFLPLSDEPDITPFLRRMLRSGRSIWAPSLTNAFDLGSISSETAAAEALIWSRLHDLDHVQPSPRGFRRPTKVPMPPPENALVLVPGLAFTRSGDRLGRGGGHYDRFLARYHGIRIGICFRQQLLPNLPMQPHDQLMDWVVTESALNRGLPGAK